MKKVLITGGAGYIGSLLVSDFLQLKYQVTVLDSFRFGQHPLNHLCRAPLLEIVRGDVRDTALVKRLASDADLILPLAGLVGASLCDQHVEEAVQVNQIAIAQLADMISPSQLVVLPTSNSGYGVGTGDVYCTEETPLNPISLYGRTKAQAEESIMQRENSISLRFATLFGMSPRMRWDLLVNNFVWHAVHGTPLHLYEGHFRRNFLHVRDAVYAFEFCSSRFAQMRGQIYNVGLSSANTSKRDLAEKVRQRCPGFVVECDPEGKDPDQRNYIVSNRKIEALGFQPQHTLDFGIRELKKGAVMYDPDPWGHHEWRE